MPGRETTQLVLDELKEHRTLLFQIKEQTTKTNGRVTALEVRSAAIEKALSGTQGRVGKLENRNHEEDHHQVQEEKQDERKFKWWQFTFRDALPVLISAVALIIAFTK